MHEGTDFSSKQADAEQVICYLAVEAAEGAVACFEDGDCLKKDFLGTCGKLLNWHFAFIAFMCVTH